MDKKYIKILCWDYLGTGDIAPWDYDEGVYGNGWDDAVAFIGWANWDKPVIGNEVEFKDRFGRWLAEETAYYAREGT